MWTDAGPLLILLAIVLFWAIIFAFAFWFSTRALRAPRGEAHDAAIEVGDSVPTNPAH